REPTRCVSAREIERAVLEREAPVQRVGTPGRHRGKQSTSLVNVEIGRCVRHRVLQRHRAGDGKWAKPRQGVRCIAKSLAEEDPGTKRIKLWLHDRPIRRVLADGFKPKILKRKVKNGISPNITHAVDSSHLR